MSSYSSFLELSKWNKLSTIFLIPTALKIVFTTYKGLQSFTDTVSLITPSSPLLSSSFQDSINDSLFSIEWFPISTKKLTIEEWQTFLQTNQWMEQIQLFENTLSLTKEKLLSIHESKLKSSQLLLFQSQCKQLETLLQRFYSSKQRLESMMQANSKLGWFYNPFTSESYSTTTLHKQLSQVNFHYRQLHLEFFRLSQYISVLHMISEQA